MIIAVASGKGGTGKTTIATSLAVVLARSGVPVSFLDGVVEAPNAHIFLRPELDQEKPVTLPIPKVNTDLCKICGHCATVCQFHAIVVLGGKTLVFPQLCHGCGSCRLQCPEDAITEIPKELGMLESGKTSAGIDFAHGILNVGEPMAVPVINQLKDWQNLSNAGIVILDSPPGASCPVVESLRGSDCVLLVTEPTPFGLHDLKSAVELTRELNIPAGVIINRDGIGDSGVEEYCRETELPIFLRIPFDREIGQGIAEGRTLIDIRPEYGEHLIALSQKLGGLIAQEEGKR